jgi:hypothetical protein
MAGTCCHVCGLFHAIIKFHREPKASTSVACAWLAPSKVVEAVRVDDMEVFKPRLMSRSRRTRPDWDPLQFSSLTDTEVTERATKNLAYIANSGAQIVFRSRFKYATISAIAFLFCFDEIFIGTGTT